MKEGRIRCSREIAVELKKLAAELGVPLNKLRKEDVFKNEKKEYKKFTF